MNQISFFRNWWELAENRDTDEKRLAFYDAIFRFAFEDKVPERPVRGVSRGVDYAAWDAYQSVLPIISESSRKSRAGSLGGKAPREARREAETESETSTARSKNATPLEENRIEENRIEATAEANGSGGRFPSLKRVVAWATSQGGVPEDFARRLYDELLSVNWKGPDGERIRGWERFFKAAWNREQSKHVESSSDADVRPAKITEDDL